MDSPVFKIYRYKNTFRIEIFSSGKELRSVSHIKLTHQKFS